MTGFTSLPLGPSPSSDVGRGLLRMSGAMMRRAGLQAGEVLTLGGARISHARALPWSNQECLGCDPILARNLGLSWGAVPEISAANLGEIHRLELMVEEGQRLVGAAQDWSVWLRDMAVTRGDFLGRSAQPSHLIRADALFDAQGAPLDAGLVTAKTQIVLPNVARSFAGIGGLASEIASVREVIELPLTHPALFTRLGITPPRGILFTGPPGTGKTLLAHRVAEECNCAFFHIAGPEIMSKHYGESEAMLRDLFEKAEKSAPSVLFIDEIDAIAPRRDALSGEKQLERRLVAQLLTLMDGLTARGRVVVLAATNIAHMLDPALRRPGRFDREIKFHAPDAAARSEILAVHLSRAPLSQDTDLEQISAKAHGYVGADLAALAAEAGFSAARRALAERRVEAVEITQADLFEGLARTFPSALRDALVETPAIGWADIGGYEAEKAALTRAVIWPLTHRDRLAALGLHPSKGVLLIGPPGTGKTLMAQALAAESGMNFISVPPSQLVSQFQGETERAIADLFARARNARPALLLIDEIDALAPRRNGAQGPNDRIVAQFLQELDGLSDNRGLTLVGATNRPRDIDPALIRQGRFDLVVEIGPPDLAARSSILKVKSRGRPLSDAIDLEDLAAKTEGFSGADLAALIDQAARHALVRQMADPTEPQAIILQDDFARACAEARAQFAARQSAPMERETQERADG